MCATRLCISVARTVFICTFEAIDESTAHLLLQFSASHQDDGELLDLDALRGLLLEAENARHAEDQLPGAPLPQTVDAGDPAPSCIGSGCRGVAMGDPLAAQTACMSAVHILKLSVPSSTSTYVRVELARPDDVEAVARVSDLVVDRDGDGLVLWLTGLALCCVGVGRCSAYSSEKCIVCRISLWCSRKAGRATVYGEIDCRTICSLSLARKCAGCPVAGPPDATRREHYT